MWLPGSREVPKAEYLPSWAALSRGVTGVLIISGRLVLRIRGTDRLSFDLAP
jgi:hypothetical protein